MSKVIIGDYEYENFYYNPNLAKARVVDKTKTSYGEILSSVTIDGEDFTVSDLTNCFAFCQSLVHAPAMPSGAQVLSGCFYGSSLTEAPEIPSGVTRMSQCFQSCQRLSGNVVVNNTPEKYTGVFYETANDIFIVNKGSGETVWRSIASEYANVHYEADDNQPPLVSNFTATRVSSSGSTAYDVAGKYAYVQARLMVYDNLIPVGWTNELKATILKKDGVQETVTWQPQITGYPADVHCWIYLGDLHTHTLSLQITDSIKDDNNVEKRSQSSSELSVVIPKGAALLDFIHDDITGAEGVAIGKYAEMPDVFDVDMTTYFRQSISVYHNIYADGNIESEDGDVSAVNMAAEGDITADGHVVAGGDVMAGGDVVAGGSVLAAGWAGFVQMFAGTTPPTGWLLCNGSEVAVADYPTLYSVIGNTYGTPSDADHFLLPNLTNRFPVGAGSDYALNDTGGSEYIQEHSHSFTQPTVNNGGGASITGGSHHHATNRKKNAASGSAIYVPDGGSTTNGISTTDTTHSHSLPNHAHSVQGGAVNAVKDVTAGNGGNLPPYIGINFIICTGEIS